MPRLTSLAAAAALLACGPALAGGFNAPVVTSPPASPVPAPVASADWSGFYVGGQLGWGEADLSADVDDAVAGPVLGDVLDDLSLGFDGAVYGLHAGYQRDFGRFVAGGELAYVLTNIMLLDVEDPGSGESLEAGFDHVLRAGGRVGYDGGRLMPFAAAGLARATLSADLSGLGGPDIEETYGGFYFGAGLEFAVSDRFSVGAEVLRHYFDVDQFDEFTIPDGIELTADVTTFGLRASLRF